MSELEYTSVIEKNGTSKERTLKISLGVPNWPRHGTSDERLYIL